MSPHIVLALYFGVALLSGFWGMMYLHALERQDKPAPFDGVDAVCFSMFWFATLPLGTLLGALYLMNLLAKKASIILTPKEDE